MVLTATQQHNSWVLYLAIKNYQTYNDMWLVSVKLVEIKQGLLSKNPAWLGLQKWLLLTPTVDTTKNDFISVTIICTQCGRKKGTNFFVCVFLVLDRNWWIFSHTLFYKLQFRVFNFGKCWEFYSDSDIKRFMFTSQVMKLMITC